MGKSLFRIWTKDGSKAEWIYANELLEVIKAARLFFGVEPYEYKEYSPTSNIPKGEQLWQYEDGAFQKMEGIPKPESEIAEYMRRRREHWKAVEEENVEVRLTCDQMYQLEMDAFHKGISCEIHAQGRRGGHGA